MLFVFAVLAAGSFHCHELLVIFFFVTNFLVYDFRKTANLPYFTTQRAINLQALISILH